MSPDTSPAADFAPPAVLSILLTLATVPPDAREDTLEAVEAAMRGGERVVEGLFAAAEAVT